MKSGFLNKERLKRIMTFPFAKAERGCAQNDGRCWMNKDLLSLRANALILIKTQEKHLASFLVGMLPDFCSGLHKYSFCYCIQVEAMCKCAIAFSNNFYWKLTLFLRKHFFKMKTFICKG